MAKKTETIIHPLSAIDALQGYHQDVSLLMAAAQSALLFMSDRDLDGRKVCDSVGPELRRALDRARRWYE
jgi:hypothetical protein